MPRVSVIIPNYNHEKYLKQRLESILNQSYHDFEIILLDDGSSDNSKFIIEHFRSNPKIAKIIYNEVNSNNTFLQWEKGMEEAKGDLIWIAESDDYCEINFLETLVEALDSDLSISLAYCQSYVIDEQDCIQYISVERALAKKMSGNDFIQTHMTAGNSIFNASMAVFKKDIISSRSGQYLDFRFCGDWMFWIEQAVNRNVFISGKVLNYYRQHSENLTSRYSKSGMRYIEELKILFYLLDNDLINTNLFKKSLMQRYIMYNLNKKSINKENIKEIENVFYLDKRTRKFRIFLALNFLREKLYRQFSFFARIIFRRNIYSL